MQSEGSSVERGYVRSVVSLQNNLYRFRTLESFESIVHDRLKTTTTHTATGHQAM